MTAIPKANLTLIPSAEVTRRTSISRTQVWRLVREGRFPRPVHITGKRSGWIELEIDEWIAERIAARDAGRGAE